MGEKLVIGPINKGLKTDRTPFVIDNDSFPVLQNAYQWRGRVKRKRGTSYLARLTRYFNSTNPAYSATASIALVAGAQNLLVGFSLQTGGSIVPGSAIIVDTTASNTYTDNSLGILTGSPSGSGTINYASGAITISAGATDSITASFLYYPTLPVLGIEDLTLIPTQFPGTLAFDDVYSYNVVTASPYPTYDVSFYANPATGTYPSYVQKTYWTPTTWNGEDYQQYWSTNYQGAFWVTNGIQVPFSSSNIGMQFKNITAMTITTATMPDGPSIVTLTIVAHKLVVGDFLFINEVVYTSPNSTNSINFQTGYVISVVDANNVSVEFPDAYLTGTYSKNGIAQYLTNRSNTSVDCLRYYTGDPTDGNSTTPTLEPGNGWVNFCPPISQSNFSIGGLIPAQYYLVGCRMIIPFKDRLIFLGVVVTTSAGGVYYLPDTIVYSQNGTPFYTCSFTGDPTFATTEFFPILTPANQTATAGAYFSDSTGFGGFISAGLDQPITTASFNEDVIIVGFSNFQTRLAYSGSDIIPFNFFIINSEYGSSSTFSAINFDKGVVSKGSRGFVVTGQTDCQRIDLEIPDEVFEINLTENGNERLCAVRNYIDEWIYFTFPENNDSYRYPNQTLMWNYRDNSWAIHYESYTTYGQFRRQTGFIWSTVGMFFPSWSVWNEPWDAGETTLLQPEVIAGNQQGFLIIRDIGTGEATSLDIQNITAITGLVTSPDHNLVDGDYIIISGIIGTAGYGINGNTYLVGGVTQNTFTTSPIINLTTTYIGGGLITKIYVPLVQTKQFPTAWSMGRKTRIGMQQYLLSTTNDAQITLQIYLSQNAQSPYNAGAIVPAVIPDPPVNNALVYSQVLYTCPESTNLGLTPANINLQTPTATQQAQIWHRVNTSLIGDTVQLGFTLSADQVMDLNIEGASFPITGATQASPCVLTCAGAFEIGQLINIESVMGMTQLNGNDYLVITSDSTTVTIDVDSTAFTAYVSGGTATVVAGINAFAEIELHGIIIDINPSQLLA